MACRGGPTASTHVEILANNQLMKDVLLIAAGGTLEDQVISGLDDLVAKIDLEKDLRTAPR